MSIVESLNLSPIRRGGKKSLAVNEELSKYFVPAYESIGNLRREKNIFMKIKENERIYNEAYRKFHERKEKNPNFGRTKHLAANSNSNNRNRKKKQKSEADLFKIHHTDELGEYIDHPNFKSHFKALNKFTLENRRRAKILKQHQHHLKKLEERQCEIFFNKRAKREQQIHERLVGSKQLIQEKMLNEKIRRMRKRNKLLINRGDEQRRKKIEWNEKRSKMRAIELGKTLQKEQQVKYCKYTRLRTEAEKIQRKNEQNFNKSYGSINNHPLVRQFINNS